MDTTRLRTRVAVGEFRGTHITMARDLVRRERKDLWEREWKG